MEEISSARARRLLIKTLPVHPAFRLDLREPVLGRGNPSEVFFYVLFSDIPDRDGNAIKVEYGDAKDAFGEENPFGVMAHGPVTEVGEERLRFVKPTVDREVVLGCAAEFLCTASCVFNWVSHS